MGNVPWFGIDAGKNMPSIFRKLQMSNFQEKNNQWIIGHRCPNARARVKGILRLISFSFFFKLYNHV